MFLRSSPLQPVEKRLRVRQIGSRRAPDRDRREPVRDAPPGPPRTWRRMTEERRLGMLPWPSRWLRRFAKAPTVEQLLQRIAGSLRDGECLSGLTSLIAPDRVIRPGKLRVRHFDQAGAGRNGVAEIERDHPSLVARLRPGWISGRAHLADGVVGGIIPCFGVDCLLAREPLSPHGTSGYGPILLPSGGMGSPPISLVAAPGLGQTETAAGVKRCPERRLRLSLGAEEDSR